MESPASATGKRLAGELAGETPEKRRQVEDFSQTNGGLASKKLDFSVIQASAAQEVEQLPVSPAPERKSHAQRRWEKESGKAGGCFKCGHGSHWARDCPFEHLIDARRDGQCFSCSKAIHLGERIGLVIYEVEEGAHTKDSKQWVHAICGLQDADMVESQDNDWDGYHASIAEYPESSFEKRVLQWVADGRGHAMVTARAGCGKSELLIRTSRHVDQHLFRTSWIVLVYNKDAQQELVKREISNCGAKTFHAVGRQVCEDNGISLARSKHKVFMDELVRARSVQAQDLASRRCTQTLVRPFRAMAKRLSTLAKEYLYVPQPWYQQYQQLKGMGGGSQRLSYCLKEATEESLHALVALRGLDYAYRDHSARVEIVAEAVGLALAVLRETLLCALGQSELPHVNGCYLDFADMMYLPLALAWRVPQFDLVLVDEAQDSNPCRRAMVCEMLTEQGRCLAVGDPCQAIYEFTGADAAAMDKLAADLERATGRECQHFALPVSHRVPQHIADYVNDTFRPELGDVNLQSRKQGGVVVSGVDFADDDGRPRGGHAVLSRTNAALLGLRRVLLGKGIACRMLGRKALANDALWELNAVMAKWHGRGLEVGGFDLDLAVRGEIGGLEAGVDGENKGKSTSSTQHRIDMLRCLALLYDEKGRCVDEVRKSLEADVQLQEEHDLAEDTQDAPKLVTLATVHKAKGLQWPTVHILQPKHLEWSTAREERNCRYVACTRAQQELRFLRHIPDLKHDADPALWMLPLFQHPPEAPQRANAAGANLGNAAGQSAALVPV